MNDSPGVTVTEQKRDIFSTLRRDSGVGKQSRVLKFFDAVLPFVFALVIISAVTAILGVNPLDVLSAIIAGSLRTPFNISQTIMVACLLSLTALAAALPFAAKLWNIGGQGQLYAGAFVAAGIGIAIPATSSPWLTIPVILGASMMAGALFALVPAILKATIDASEVIVSLMLNFIGLLLVNLAITNLWKHPFAPQTDNVVDAARLPIVWQGTRLNLGAVIGFAVVVLVALFVSRTKYGFAIRATGWGPEAARLAGFKPAAVIVVAFATGGAMAGLAGGIAVIGSHGALISGLALNYGFVGVAVALLARLNVWWIIPSAAFFSIQLVGSNSLPARVGLDASLGYVLVSVFLLLLLATHAIRVHGR